MVCRRRLWRSVLAVFVALATACAAEEADTGQIGETAPEPAVEQVEPEASEPEAASTAVEPEPESAPAIREAEAEPDPAPTTSAAPEAAAEPEPEATPTTVAAAEPETTTGEPEAEHATESESDAASEPESEEEPVEAEPPPEEDKAPEPESDTVPEPEPATAPEPESEEEPVGEEEPPPEEDEAQHQPVPEPQPSSGVAEVLARLDALTVAAEHTSGYDRHLFKHWTDEDDDGCDTRREVLLAEAVVAPTRGSRCSLSDGEWISRYDGLTEVGNGRGFDVDHLVPLAEAWESGAHGWSADRRERYANDLGYEHSLIAVSARSNRSKGAQDPATWLPPEEGQHCWYAAAWVHVKTRWMLSVDTAEVTKLQSVLSGCSDDAIDVSLPAPIVQDQDTNEQGADSTPEDPATETPEEDCHPAYTPCLPNLPGDAVNCGDLTSDQKPVTVNEIGVDPYRLDRDGDGRGCTS